MNTQGIVEALFERAVALWGTERAADLRPILEQTAQNLWTLSRNLPEKHIEPGVIMLKRKSVVCTGVTGGWKSLIP